MTTSIAILVMENAFVSWLFNYAPVNAIVIVLVWVALRLGSSYGKCEERFTRIEADIVELKNGQKELTVKVENLGHRLGRLEAQMEIIIDLLKGKKSI